MGAVGHNGVEVKIPPYGATRFQISTKLLTHFWLTKWMLAGNQLKRWFQCLMAIVLAGQMVFLDSGDTAGSGAAECLQPLVATTHNCTVRHSTDVLSLKLMLEGLTNVPTRTVQWYSNNKLWVTNGIMAVLNAKKKAFRDTGDIWSSMKTINQQESDDPAERETVCRWTWSLWLPGLSSMLLRAAGCPRGPCQAEVTDPQGQ
ncbi:uncharacterized protein V6R79_014132 [Siganus canaliculatus]